MDAVALLLNAGDTVEAVHQVAWYVLLQESELLSDLGFPTDGHVITNAQVCGALDRIAANANVTPGIARLAGAYAKQLRALGARGSNLAKQLTLPRRWPNTWARKIHHEHRARRRRPACDGSRRLVNPVNTAGIMGKGLALQFKHVNFPTKQHWRKPSKLDFIREGLVDLVAQIHAREIQSIAVPALGCGLGGLPWADVKPLIHAALGDLQHLRVVLFEPA